MQLNLATGIALLGAVVATIALIIPADNKKLRRIIGIVLLCGAGVLGWIGVRPGSLPPCNADPQSRGATDRAVRRFQQYGL